MLPRKLKCIDCDKVCFPKNKESPRCRSCSLNYRRKLSGFESNQEYRRNWAMLKKYDIDLSGFDALWIAFKGKCGICNNDLILPTKTRGQGRRSAVIDHDHKTGNLRGLLCNSCNKALGLFDDNYETLKQAVAWLGDNHDNN